MLNTTTAPNLRFLLPTLCVLAAGCNTDERPKPSSLGNADSITQLNTLLSARSQELQTVTTEKDTLIATLQTAMSLSHDIESLQKEIDRKPVRRGAKTSEALPAWDAQVREQISDVRARIKEQREALARASERLKALAKKNTALAAQLAQSLQTIELLQADNQQQAAHIQQLSLRIEGLERDKTQLLAETRAKGDTIGVQRDDLNRVFWIAGTKDQLRKLGVIKQQGGKSLLVTRVGETFTPGNDLNPTLFQALDKSRDSRIVLPDDAVYEIVSPQNVAYATPTTPKPRQVRGQIVINDKRFWDNSPYLILMRR
jgi:chromosome segregation ATPase